MKANSLFILFYFPPFARVGGRRWAKYLKYLYRQNHNFKVLAGDYKTTSPWDKDITEYESRITRIPVEVKYPFYKQKLPNSFFEKVIWKLSYYYWSRKESTFNGNFWDDSVNYENAFLKQAIQMIENNHIDQVVISLGPFRLSKIIITIKEKYPNIKIIIDYRDYWHDSFVSLTELQKQEELKLQATVLKHTDKVLVVNQEMQHYFKKTLHFKNVFVLPHCYDEEDFKTLILDSRKKGDNVIRFVYGGALYANMENHLTDFIQFVNKLHNQNSKVEVDFYSAQEGYKGLFETSLVKVNIHNYIPLEKYMKVINDSDVILFFRPDWSPNAMSSKFFEMIRLKKTILYFGPQSDVSDFINTNRLGLHYSKSWTDDQIKRILSDIKEDTLLNKSYDIEQHSFETSTHELMTLLNE